MGLASHFLDAPAGGLASLTGLTSLNTLAVGAGDYYHPGNSAVHWPLTDRDDVMSLMTGMRSRQNSYCSHGSRWSYSSHVEQSLGNLRSASRLDSSTGGTRSCRNSLLATAAHAAFPSACHQCGGTSTGRDSGSLSEDASFWPPDYVVRPLQCFWLLSTDEWFLRPHIRFFFLFDCSSAVLEVNKFFKILVKLAKLSTSRTARNTEIHFQSCLFCCYLCSLVQK